MNKRVYDGFGYVSRASERVYWWGEGELVWMSSKGPIHDMLLER